ncbi:MAG: hypothetical protein Q7O66_04175 [Dehalococcoidia bacterium]|nr:hypothetical protein [Dehalococcoidia bacterium]
MKSPFFPNRGVVASSTKIALGRVFAPVSSAGARQFIYASVLAKRTPAWVFAGERRG